MVSLRKVLLGILLYAAVIVFMDALFRDVLSTQWDILENFSLVEFTMNFLYLVGAFLASLFILARDFLLRQTLNVDPLMRTLFVSGTFFLKTTLDLVMGMLHFPFLIVGAAVSAINNGSSQVALSFSVVIGGQSIGLTGYFDFSNVTLFLGGEIRVVNEVKLGDMTLVKQDDSIHLNMAFSLFGGMINTFGHDSPVSLGAFSMLFDLLFGVHAIVKISAVDQIENVFTGILDTLGIHTPKELFDYVISLL